MQNTISLKKYCFALLAFGLLLASCNGSKRGTVSSKDPVKNTPGVHFQKSNTLSAVLDKAAKENKVVFVDMYTTWCLPCKIMDENVFSDQGVGTFMNDNFINYKVDTEKGTGPNLRDLYGVLVYPTLLFLDAKGKVLVRKEGGVGHTELMNLGNEALSLNVAN